MTSHRQGFRAIRNRVEFSDCSGITAGRAIRNIFRPKSNQKPFVPIRKTVKALVEQSENVLYQSDTRQSENLPPL